MTVDETFAAQTFDSPAPEPALPEEEVTATMPVLPEVDAPLAVDGPGLDLRLIAGVGMEVSVRLGQTSLALRDLMNIGPGSLIELDRAVDAPVEVLVNGTVIALGEIVVVDGEFAVRIVSLVGEK